MFDLNKLGDMAKIASQAKDLQKSQDRYQQKQLQILENIASQLSEILNLLKNKKD